MSAAAGAPASSSNRREARRLAMCAMYSREVTAYSAAETLARVMNMKPEEPEWPEFAKHLIHVVEDHGDEIVRDLELVLENWQMDRVAPVERAILKLGCAEISFFPDIPPRVTINEYIELAKTYANDHAPAFINGVLDRLSHLKGKKDFQAARQQSVPRVYSASGQRPPAPVVAPTPPASVQAPTLPPAAAPATPFLPPRVDLEKIASGWARELYEVLAEFGGSAATDELYRRIEERGCMPLSAEWQTTVQGTLDRYNADSFNFEGDPGDPNENLFVRVDRKEWALRNR